MTNDGILADQSFFRTLKRTLDRPLDWEHGEYGESHE